MKSYKITVFIWNIPDFPMMRKRAFATLLLFCVVAKGCLEYSIKRLISAVLIENKLQKQRKKPFATIATFAPKGFPENSIGPKLD